MFGFLGHDHTLDGEHMKLLCIDPGTHESGVVEIETDTMTIIECHPELNNWRLVSLLPYSGAEHMAIEMIASYGLPVGASTFETCLWIGRFIHAFNVAKQVESHTLIYRKDVKMTLCQSMRAKDAHVRQAILDRYEPIGGGKTPQIGTKNKPGPLYGVKSHAMSALAVGHTWVEQRGEKWTNKGEKRYSVRKTGSCTPRDLQDRSKTGWQK